MRCSRRRSRCSRSRAASLGTSPARTWSAMRSARARAGRRVRARALRRRSPHHGAAARDARLRAVPFRTVLLALVAVRRCSSRSPSSRTRAARRARVARARRAPAAHSRRQLSADRSRSVPLVRRRRADHRGAALPRCHPAGPARDHGAPVALALSSALFALSHLGAVSAIAYALVAGLVLRRRRRPHWLDARLDRAARRRQRHARLAPRRLVQIPGFNTLSPTGTLPRTSRRRSW